MSGVEIPSDQYLYMAAQWALPLTLLGGVSKMKGAGEGYLPKEPRETKEAYKVRLARTSLFNVYKKTVQSAAGQALSEPLIISNVPKELEFLQNNATGDGRSMTEIADDLVQEHLIFGKSHIIVDFPTSASAEMNYSEFKQAGFRPYLNIVSSVSLIGWEYNLDMGYPRLDLVRLSETEIERSTENPWLTQNKKQVRVWHNDFVEVYKYNDGVDQYIPEDNVYRNSLGFIPLITGYAAKKGFMLAEPPLEDLAQINLTHWQSSSDQRNILHIARVPFILASGFGSDELQGMEIGSNRVVNSTNAEADMKYIEHTGKAIEAGSKDLASLEEQMRVLGAEIFMGQSKDRQTATARQLDSIEAMSLMQLTTRSVLRMIKDAYVIAGMWLGVDASDVTVQLGQTAPSEPNPTAAIVSMKDLPLTNTQLFEEAKRRGIISPDAKYDEAALKAERDKRMEEQSEAAEALKQESEENLEQSVPDTSKGEEEPAEEPAEEPPEEPS